MKTILGNRVVWGDGSVSFTPEELLEYVLNGGAISNGIFITGLNEDIKNFSRLNPSLKLNVKRDLDHLNTTWNIPDSYKNMDVYEHICKKMERELEIKSNLTEEQTNIRVDRVIAEFNQFKENDMLIILKAVIYIVDMFKKNNMVWGTGRGSSCASYILYLLGLHMVDSVEHEVNMFEFFK